MPTLKLDHIIGANLTQTEQVVQTPAGQTLAVITEYHRRAYVTDITIPSDPADTLLEVLRVTGMPKYGDPLSANYPGLTLRNRQVVSSSEINRLVTLDLLYSDRVIYLGQGGGSGSVTWTKTVRSFDQIVECGYNPITGDLFEWYFDASDTGGSNDDKKANIGTVAKPTPFNARIRLPAAQVILNAVYDYEPSSPTAFQGYVNSDSSFLERGVGYWRLDSAGIQATSDGKFATQAVLASNLLFDWGQMEIAYNTHLSRYVKIDKTAFKTVAKRAYSQGVDPHNGFTRLDIYPTTSFATLFGFS